MLHIQGSPVARTIFQLQVRISIFYRQRNAHTFSLTFCSWKNRKQSKPACLRVGELHSTARIASALDAHPSHGLPCSVSWSLQGDPAHAGVTAALLLHALPETGRPIVGFFCPWNMLKSKKLTNINKLTNRLTHKTRQNGRVNMIGNFTNGNFTWFKCGGG